MMGNKSLHKSRKAANDEFYTQLADVENELRHYTDYFDDKVVYCNCDDFRYSKFYEYFIANFERLKLKRLILTCIDIGKGAYKAETTDGKNIEIDLIADGDFRSPECVAILKRSDIVVTNPPFSLFRSYIAQLVEHDKKFIIVGSMNAITYKETFALIQDDRMWLGAEGRISNFVEPDGTIKKLGNVVWYTNLQHYKRNEFITLTEKYYE